MSCYCAGLRDLARLLPQILQSLGLAELDSCIGCPIELLCVTQLTNLDLSCRELDDEFIRGISQLCRLQQLSIYLDGHTSGTPRCVSSEAENMRLIFSASIFLGHGQAAVGCLDWQ